MYLYLKYLCTYPSVCVCVCACVCVCLHSKLLMAVTFREFDGRDLFFALHISILFEF